MNRTGGGLRLSAGLLFVLLHRIRLRDCSVAILKRLHQLVEFVPPFPREANDHLLPPSRRGAVARRIGRQSHLTNRLRLKAERLRQLRRAKAKQVRCGSEVHVHTALTESRLVDRLLTAATKNKAGCSPAKKNHPALSVKRPEGRLYSSAARC